MNRPELYQKTLDTLVDAYHKDELQHGKCKACAVGNILKDTAKSLGIGRGEWGNKFCTFGSSGNKRQVVAGPGKYLGFDPRTYNWRFAALDPKIIFYYSPTTLMEFRSRIQKAEKLIAASGYTQDELAKIEYAFEAADEGSGEEDYMFNGLMAVVDVLDQIHENTDTIVTDTQKKRFVIA